MTNELTITIENKIYIIRGQQVMIDRDIAQLYGVETRVLNQAVKRNEDRFPEEFCFQLDDSEFENWISQIVISNSEKMGLRKKPYAFTEQGVAMLSAVLKSETAVKMSIQIMKAFVAMRKFMLLNAQVFQRLDNIEKHQLTTDNKIEELFDRMDKYKIEDKQGIFFQGQIFDAYSKFESFIAQAKTEIILIDGYVDLTVLDRLAKKKKNVTVEIYTDAKTKLTAQDVQKFNAQYPQLNLNYTSKMHDRFLIIDKKTLYHIGASLKDLGKKCFAFEVLDVSLIPTILQNL
ncbi:MAG: ORF6N domain-containing protein [Spirochaetia bacterium]|uniref:ORF6N domain-containing protein n=1 Tax=Treponema porcinum TaxID=261392 RepID=UPI002A815F80|nr:ORF6N domain-containing protein [Treponema porcinum]MCI6185756.1 ORF6N domain-containing protein [Spirochaetia bacterium]MDY4467156.1 ORF6N domain-containing protein [Treponema porcinum]